jgi:hypothetical protein
MVTVSAKTTTDRRRWIGQVALGALALCAGRATAFGPASRFRVGLLAGTGSEDQADAWARLHLELSRRTSVECVARPVVVQPTENLLFTLPFVVLSGSEGLPKWTPEAWVKLARYLAAGGFLWIDNRGEEAFSASVLERLGREFSAESTVQIDKEHVLYRSFYLLEGEVGRRPGSPNLRGLRLDGRMAVLAGTVDLAGAFERDTFGAWRHRCEPGGEPQREQAIRFAVNLVMYSVCTDYKADQVHIPFLLKRRQ